MHLLHLLRHAKSSWKEDADDHERPLSRSGRETARRLARHLPVVVGEPDFVLCSTARRARETLDLVLGELARPPRRAIEAELYLASEARLFERLRRLPETAGNVLVVGHNPGLHELAVSLAAPGSPQLPFLVGGKFPTAALASFRIDGAWSGLRPGHHPLIGYVTPESLCAEGG